MAAALSPRKPLVPGIALVAGLAATIGRHALPDYTPHSYPIKSGLDVALALILFCLAFSIAKAHTRLLVVLFR